MIDYTTLFDYLHLLCAITNKLKSLQRRALVYLAAAVSDFYIPMERMVRKIVNNHRYRQVFRCAYLLYQCLMQTATVNIICDGMANLPIKPKHLFHHSIYSSAFRLNIKFNRTKMD